MADGVFNVGKGRVNEYVRRVNNNDPAASTLVVLLLKLVETDATIKDYETLFELLSAAGNTEADFTNYGRKVLTDSDLSDPTVDHGNDRQDADFPNQTWISAGGAINNNLVKAIVCYDTSLGGSPEDDQLILLTFHDFVITTNGGDITLQTPNGFFRAGE